MSHWNSCSACVNSKTRHLWFYLASQSFWHWRLLKQTNLEHLKYFVILITNIAVSNEMHQRNIKNIKQFGHIWLLWRTCPFQWLWPWLWYTSTVDFVPPKGYILVSWGEMNVQKAKLVYNFCKHFTDTSLTFLSFWTKSYGEVLIFFPSVSSVNFLSVLGLFMNPNGESCYTEQSLNTPQQQRFLAKWLTQPLMECRMSLFIFHN